MLLELGSVTGELLGGRRTQLLWPLKPVRRMCPRAEPVRANTAAMVWMACMVGDSISR